MPVSLRSKEPFPIFLVPRQVLGISVCRTVFCFASPRVKTFPNGVWERENPCRYKWFKKLEHPGFFTDTQLRAGTLNLQGFGNFVLERSTLKVFD